MATIPISNLSLSDSSQESDDHQSPSGHQTEAQITSRRVVANFIFQYPPDSDKKGVKVALFRRSDKVSTYKGKLAPCSGGIEPQDENPLAAALREIREETALKGNSLELIRPGKPYSFTDESIGREWIIHPFAWRLKDPAEGEAGISLDWEHDSYEWHDPLRVNQSEEFGGTPGLVDSLRRVWPEYDLGSVAGGILTKGLEDLQNDHQSGAKQLADKALLILRRVVETMDASSSAESKGDDCEDLWWTNVRMAAWHISKNGREAMGSAINSAIVHAFDHIYGDLENHDIENIKTSSIYDIRSGPVVLTALNSIDDTLGCRTKFTGNILVYFARYLADFIDPSGGEYNEKKKKKKKKITILTISNSSTIVNCLDVVARAIDIHMDIRILESRPLFEGVKMAAELRRLYEEAKERYNEDMKGSLNITLFTDASAAIAAEGVDFVLLGADAIAPNGDVSNKIGSLPAVLCARHVNEYAPSDDSVGVKVVVLSDTEKIAASSSSSPSSQDFFDKDHNKEDNHPGEVMHAWKKSCTEKTRPFFSSTTAAEAAGDDDDDGSAAGEWEEEKTIQVRNRYFEWIPSQLIDAYITDKGQICPGGVREISESTGEQLEKFFGGL